MSLLTEMSMPQCVVCILVLCEDNPSNQCCVACEKHLPTGYSKPRWMHGKTRVRFLCKHQITGLRDLAGSWSLLWGGLEVWGVLIPLMPCLCVSAEQMARCFRLSHLRR